MTEIIEKERRPQRLYTSMREQIGHLVMIVHMKGLDFWRRPIVTEDRKYGMHVP